MEPGLEGESTQQVDRKKTFIGRYRLRVQGSLQDERLEGAPPPRRDFFLSRVKRDTNDETIKEYINDKGIPNAELTVVSNVNAKYKSYRLSVCIDYKDKVMSSDMWPKGVCIERWRERTNATGVLNSSKNGDGS